MPDTSLAITPKDLHEPLEGGRCRMITKAGKPCKRNGYVNHDGYCHLHLLQAQGLGKWSTLTGPLQAKTLESKDLPAGAKKVNAIDGKQRTGLRLNAGKIEEIHERRLAAMELRKSGLSYRAIAKKQGTAVKTAFHDVQTVLREIGELRREVGEQYIEMELVRLDSGIENLSIACDMGDVAAIRETRLLCESRRRLLGLDAATRYEHSGVGGSAIEVEHSAVPMDLSGFRKSTIAALIEEGVLAKERAEAITVESKVVE